MTMSFALDRPGEREAFLAAFEAWRDFMASLPDGSMDALFGRELADVLAEVEADFSDLADAFGLSAEVDARRLR